MRTLLALLFLCAVGAGCEYPRLPREQTEFRRLTIRGVDCIASYGHGYTALSCDWTRAAKTASEEAPR